MLGERSSRMSTVSGADPAAQPSQPPTSGRERKKMSVRTARIRQARISHSRMRACRVACLEAASRNIIAAQATVRYRIRFSRWMTTGTSNRGRPQKMKG
jgi:hypothetical protein